HVFANDLILVYARVTPAGDVAFVALNKTATTQTAVVPLPLTLGIANGTTLTDRLGGASVQVSGGAIAVSLPAWGSAVWAP
ncbi:MAG TPA: hypothetical protein VLM85_20295, partial [Polyangiaceae bacterium]|nr:hypothetical protein [Polyangiaceae bacterium]